MTRPILDVRGASGGYGDFQALFSVDFEIAPGEVVALIGANGAGKSTLLNTVAGLLPVREGSVVLEPDVRKYFPNSKAVNRALRTLIEIIPSGRT